MNRWLIWAGCVASLGCAGSTGDDDTSPSKLQASCEALCKVQAAGQDCDEDGVLTACGDLCELSDLFTPEDCVDVARASNECLLEVEYTCEGGYDFDGVVYPIPTSDECNEVSLAYSTCLSEPTT